MTSRNRIGGLMLAALVAVGSSTVLTAAAAMPASNPGQGGGCAARPSVTTAAINSYTTKATIKSNPCGAYVESYTYCNAAFPNPQAGGLPAVSQYYEYGNRITGVGSVSSDNCGNVPFSNYISYGFRYSFDGKTYFKVAH